MTPALLGEETPGNPATQIGAQGWSTGLEPGIGVRGSLVQALQLTHTMPLGTSLPALGPMALSSKEQNYSR